MLGFYKESLFKRYPFSAKSDSDVAIADFREFFKADGVADAFVDRYLKAFVSDSEGKHQLRRLDGQGLPLSPVFLAQMNRTQVIRRSFFAENPAEPLVLFAGTLRPGLQRQPRRLPVRRPAAGIPPRPDHRQRLPLAGRGRERAQQPGAGGTGRPPRRHRQRQWPLGAVPPARPDAQVEQHSGRDVLLLKANLSGLQAKYLLHSQRSPNPFDASLLRQFKLPATL